MELNHYNPPSQPKQTACLGKQCKGRVETICPCTSKEYHSMTVTCVYKER